jgi:hypothetical protein
MVAITVQTIEGGKGHNRHLEGARFCPAAHMEYACVREKRASPPQVERRHRTGNAAEGVTFPGPPRL